MTYSIFCTYDPEKICKEFLCDRCEVFKEYRINLFKSIDKYYDEKL